MDGAHHCSPGVHSVAHRSHHNCRCSRIQACCLAVRGEVEAENTGVSNTQCDVGRAAGEAVSTVTYRSLAHP
jgi:hypothetical protein